MAPPRATPRHQQQQPLTPAARAQRAEQAERDKRAAARAAASLVRDSMAVGLGTGSTVAHLLAALGERAHELTRARCVATSPATARIAAELGLTVLELDQVGQLDIAIDGADQIDPHGWLLKGGGGAHTREKIVALAARRFVVIVSADKEVSRLRPPVALEVLRFGARRTLMAVGQAQLRSAHTGGVETGPARGAAAGVETGPAATSPDGNLLADYTGPIDDPRALAARLSAIPGVVDHGIFAPEMVTEVFVGDAGSVRRRVGAKGAR